MLREKGHETKVDLMLLDINMPGMSGLELLGQMRAEDRLKARAGGDVFHVRV